MKTYPKTGNPRGFTLIELLVVITIIAILAGLSMGGYSYVMRKQADSQADIQISLLEKALEEYKLDNGEYPATGAGQKASTLFEPLYRKGRDNPNQFKIYLAELDPINNNQGWTEGAGTNVKIIDPYGKEYIYRRGDHASAKNPDFDLASPGKDGLIGTPDDIDNY